MIDIELKKTDASNIQMLTLSGEFDLSDQERVKDLLPEVLAASSKGVIIDLSGVTHMDEAGAETIIYYLQELTRIGTHMAAIVKPESGLINKLKRLGIFDCIGVKVFSSIEDAEAAIEADKLRNNSK